MGRNYSKEDLAQLRLGRGEELHGDGALVVLKALLESGVGYLGGYPGAPTSSLYDAIADAYEDVLAPMGVYFEGSGNEAAAGALLSLSVHYPVRGAVNWKVVGSNVAADALAHVAASGVYGGALVFVGEDYGCNSTTVAEKTLPYAQKSACAVIDPKGDAPTMARMVREGFRLSEASHVPVIYLFRTRTGNLKGSIACEDNREPPISTKNRLVKAEVQLDRMTIPPFVFDQEREKFAERMPAARDYVLRTGLNEWIRGDAGRRVGIITHGMGYNTTVRALRALGEADALGRTWIDLLCLNVIYPLVPQEIADFLRDKSDVLVVEEGMPNLLEQEIRSIAQEHGLGVRLHGKDLLPMPGEYTPPVLIQGIGRFLTKTAYAANGQKARVEGRLRELDAHLARSRSSFAAPVSTRNPIFCTGCPERPVFSALKLMQRSYERPHYAQDTGCYAMGSLPPFDSIAASYTGMGTGLAAAGALSKLSERPVVSFMGDGTFWHSGLTTSVANAVYNKQESVLVIFQNFWTSMTGQQENPATGHNIRGESLEMSIPGVLREMGVKWVRETNPYDLRESMGTYRAALDAKGQGLRVIVSKAECMLEKQRRARPERKAALAAGRTVADVKLGVDDEVCTGDHSCMRVNGCPSLTVKPGPNPLRDDPIATIVNSCVGCGLCGEIAHAAVLCPSFYEARVITHPTAWQRVRFRLSRALVGGLVGVRI